MAETPTAVKNQFEFHHFDERNWTLAKIRWISLAVAFFYPVWGLVLLWVLPDSQDSVLERTPVAIMALATLWLSFRPMAQKYLHWLYHAWCFAATAQVFYLIAKNGYAPFYILGGFFTLFCAGPVLLTQAVLRYYFIFCFTISAALWAQNPDSDRLLLMMGTVNAAFFSWFGLRTMLMLIERLRQSKIEIEKQSQALGDMLNALGQGFISLGPDGVILPNFSRACLEILEGVPAGRQIWDVLRVPAADKEIFTEALPRAFSSLQDFNTFVEFFPKTFPHSAGRSVQLEYRPSLDAAGKLTQIVVVATDKTAIVEAERAADFERKNSLMIATIVKDKRLFGVFFKDLRSDLQKFSKLQTTEGSEREWALEFKRFLHSVKGAAGLFWMEEIATAVHQLESEWQQSPSGSGVAGTIRRQVNVLDSVLKKFLATHQDILGAEIESERAIEIPLSGFSSIANSPHFRASPRPLQEEFLALTLQPIVNYLGPYSSLVTKTAEQQEKDVHPVAFIGGELRIFPEPYSALFSNFVHVFRNAVDHGLEMPFERESTGKDPRGRLTVEFKRYMSSGKPWISIEVRDDGRGIDPARIRAKLVQLGQAERAASLNDRDLLQVLFEPEFTTRESVTDISGRGIGLNALLTSAQALGGSVHVESKLGAGTTFRVTVPEISIQEVLHKPAATPAA